MSRIKHIFALSVILLLASCSKDEDPGSDNKLIGKWQLKESHAEITAPGGVALRQYLIAELAMAPEQADSYVTFFQSSEAPSMDITEIEFKNDGTYVSNGNTGFSGTWEITVGDQAVIFDKETEHHMAVSVVSLSETELKLAFDISDDVGLPNIKYLTVLSFDKN